MKTIKVILFVFLLIIASFFVIRLFSHTELDDLHPNIQCDESLIDKSDVLWVIPLFDNTSISSNQEWIDYIKSKNKTLGLHGVHHTYLEFGDSLDSEYIQEGVNEFQRAFGYRPAIFKAPQLTLSRTNAKLVESNGMKIEGYWNQLTHKVYHCSDTGRFPNWAIRIF